MKTNTKKTAALLMAFGLTAAACGSTATDVVDGATDAVEEGAEVVEEEAMEDEEEAMEDEETKKKPEMFQRPSSTLQLLTTTSAPSLQQSPKPVSSKRSPVRAHTPCLLQPTPHSSRHWQTLI